jgi:hypothetical protein
MKNAIHNMLVNWKTSSAGIAMIAGSVVHLAYKIGNHTATESDWDTTVVGILSGIGLIAAGDSGTTPSPSSPVTPPPTNPPTPVK